MAMKKTTLMTEGNIWKQILFFSIPLILGNLLQQLYNTADSIIVGNFVGSEALAAVGSSGSLINLLISFCMGASAGAGVVIAQYYGANDKKRVQDAVHTTLAIAVVTGAILSIVGIVASPLLLQWMGTPKEVMPNSVLYLRIFFGGLVFNVIYNMAKNDAVSVLHATLDHRRRIDIPGYNRILLHPATRFIGTMNYGYAGTRELNEALVSRFMVIDMPEMDEDSVLFVLRQHFPDGEKSALKAFAGLFLDLQIKAYHGEISTKSLDLRGLVSAVKATRSGLSPIDAIQMGIINKSFDVFEKEIIEDVVSTRIPSSWTGKDIWG